MEGEGGAEFASRAGQIYFDAQQRENAEWWRRIGRQVDLRDQRVLEIGCGYGTLCFEAIDRGASRVTGIDPDASRVEFACGYLKAYRPEHSSTLAFWPLLLHELPEEATFDVVLSKDTFEHVQDLDQLLKEAHKRLKPGGLLVFGFSPLYHSPNGDHGRYRLPLPWLHAFLPEALLSGWAAYRLGRPIRSAADLGLNRVTCPDLLRMLQLGGWEELSLRINPIAHPLSAVFNLLRRIQPLERFFTIGVYGIFRKRRCPAEPDRHQKPAAVPPEPNSTDADGSVRQGKAPPDAAVPR
jgi:SAM-dependent methyltransferase